MMATDITLIITMTALNTAATGYTMGNTLAVGELVVFGMLRVDENNEVVMVMIMGVVIMVVIVVMVAVVKTCGTAEKPALLPEVELLDIIELVCSVFIAML